MKQGFIQKCKLFLYLSLIPVLGGFSVSSCSSSREAAEKNMDDPQYVYSSEEFGKLTWDDVAASLDIPREDIQAVTANLAGVMRYGKNSRYYEALCVKHPERCIALDEYIGDSEAAYQRRKEARRERRKLRRRLHLKSKAIGWAQRSLDVRRIIRGLRIRSESEYKRLAKKAVTTTACPRSLSAALSMRASKYFPKKWAFDLAKKLFDHAQSCLENSHPSWESLHLRHGLYAVEAGDFARAERLFVASMDGVTRKERYRALYWLGWMNHKQGMSKEENRPWQLLDAQYPLSYYSIVARNEWGQDSLSVIPERGPYELWRESKAYPAMNGRIRWLEALHLAGKSREAVRWVEWMKREANKLEVQTLHYVSALLLKEHDYRQNISWLISYYRAHPDRVSRRGLRALYPRPFFENVHEESKDKIHTNLVMSLIRQESAFDPKAVSPAQAKGLMQIIPRTARQLKRGGHRQLFDPEANTEMGVRYLVNLARRFDSEVELVLAAYNAGPRRVNHWLERFPKRDNPLLWNDLIPFTETRNYVVSILRNNYWYEKLYGPLDIDHASVLASKRVMKLTNTDHEAYHNN